MTREVSFHPLAEQELNDTASYYNAASPGLGATFLTEAERVIKQIREHPNAAPVVSGEVHRKLLRRFPYSVMYSVRTDMIRILAIANQKRRPFYWRDRT
jgi:plasmid stabilization system protein ParE